MPSTTPAASPTPAHPPAPSLWRIFGQPRRQHPVGPHDLILAGYRSRDRPADEWTAQRAFRIDGNGTNLFYDPATAKEREAAWRIGCGTITAIEVLVTMDGKEHRLEDIQETRIRDDRFVDEIQVVVTIERPGRPAEKRRLKSDMAFIDPYRTSSLTNVGVLIAKDAKLTSRNAAEFMAEAMFGQDDDDPEERRERQLKSFLDEAMEIAARILESPAAAQRLSVETAVRTHIAPRMSARQTCRITIGPNRAVHVEMDGAASTEAV